MSNDPWHALSRIVDLLHTDAKAYNPISYSDPVKRFESTIGDGEMYYLSMDPEQGNHKFALMKYTGMVTNAKVLGFSIMHSCAVFLEDTDMYWGKNEKSIIKNIPIMIRVDGEGTVPYTTVRERFLQWDWDKTEYEVFEVSEKNQNIYRFLDKKGDIHDLGVRFSSVDTGNFYYVKIRCDVDGSMKTYHLPFGLHSQEYPFEFAQKDGGKLALNYFKLAYGETVTMPALGRVVHQKHYDEHYRKEDAEGRWVMEDGNKFPSRDDANEFQKYFSKPGFIR